LGNVTAVNVPPTGSWLDPEWISDSIAVHFSPYAIATLPPCLHLQVTLCMQQTLKVTI